MLPTRGKGPLLLRLSNELLRRLPKTKQEHVVFSGRVLMFLNSVFPLGEKSGVNLRGNFNVGKVTTFQEQPSAEPAVIEIDIEAGEEKPVSQEGTSCPPRATSSPSSVQLTGICFRPHRGGCNLLHNFLVAAENLHRPAIPFRACFYLFYARPVGRTQIRS